MEELHDKEREIEAGLGAVVGLGGAAVKDNGCDETGECVADDDGDLVADDEVLVIVSEGLGAGLGDTGPAHGLHQYWRA